MLFDEHDSPLARLPIYLLLDTSATMAGAPIQALNQGVQLLFTELLNTPQAQDTAYLSVITFDSLVQVVRPLTELLAFEPPVLRTRGASRLGAAIDYLITCLEKDIQPPASGSGGDFRPLVFIITDGKPTDLWEPGLRRLQKHPLHPATIVAILCGDTAENTSRMGDVVLNMNQVTGERLLNLIKWISFDS